MESPSPSSSLAIVADLLEAGVYDNRLQLAAVELRQHDSMPTHQVWGDFAMACFHLYHEGSLAAAHTEANSARFFAERFYTNRKIDSTPVVSALCLEADILRLLGNALAAENRLNRATKMAVGNDAHRAWVDTHTARLLLSSGKADQAAIFTTRAAKILGNRPVSPFNRAWMWCHHVLALMLVAVPDETPVATQLTQLLAHIEAESVAHPFVVAASQELAVQAAAASPDTTKIFQILHLSLAPSSSH